MQREQSSTLFVRAATGLVRAWSVTDAFIYAFFSINLITLGLFSFSQMYYFEGSMIGALIVSAIFITFECLVYAALIAVMPRAGGDYVWQSRILGGGIGFILAVTGWWFILWLWVPLYSRHAALRVHHARAGDPGSDERGGLDDAAIPRIFHQHPDRLLASSSSTSPSA